MPVTTSAAVVRKFDGSFEIEEIDVDDPRGAEVLIEVKAAGLCHSDLHLASQDMGIPAPLVLGHEVSGIVQAVGSQVSTLAPGDHVVATLIQYCASCDQCLAGQPYLCSARHQTLRDAASEPRLSQQAQPVTQAFGVGGFAGHILVHENQTIRIPRQIPFPQAAVLACSTLTGAGSILNSAQVRPGDDVAIIGAGGVGLNAISAAKLVGANRIIVLDIAEDKLELARQFGATHTVNTAQRSAVESVHQITGHGVDHSFEMIGLSATSVDAVRMVKPGGSSYLVGLHRPGTEIHLDAMADIIGPQRSVHGVYMGSTSPLRDIPKYVEHYLAGRLELDSLIAKELELSQINEGFKVMASGTSVARNVITSF